MRTRWRQHLPVTIGGALLVGVILTPVHGMAAAITIRFVSVMVGRRRARRLGAQRQQQLIEFVETLTHRLRAGDSLRSALRQVAQEGDAVALELSPLMEQLGLAAALKAWTDANPTSQLVAEVERSMRFAMHNGTPVVVVLEDVLERQYRQDELADETKSLVTQASSSALLLAVLPVIFGLVVLLIDPRSLAFLFNSSLGGAVLLAALLLEFGGVRWMQRVLSEVGRA
jgi:Flp pilus assembly protein TadB